MTEQQVLIPFLPGYMWNGRCLVSTGAALSPTQVINPANGELRYYVKPIGWACSAYIRHIGILEYLETLHQSPSK